MAEVSFSVVIPAYNAEKYILFALDSLAAQTYKSVQIIVVDDGSTDATAERVQQFISEHPKADITYKKIQNSGPSTARNEGLLLAKGDYVAFLDSDDGYIPELFERLAAKAVEQPFDICYFGWVELKDGREVFRYTDKFGYTEGVTDGADIARQKYLFGLWLCNCNEVYSTKMLREAGIQYPPGCFAGEDACFIYSALLAARRVVCLHCDGFIYNIRSDSLMHASFKEYYLTEYDSVNALLQNVRDNKVISQEDKEWFLARFTALKYRIEVSIAKRLALATDSVKEYRRLVKKYKSYNDVSYKTAKPYLSKDQKQQAWLYRFNLRLFRYVYRRYKSGK